jgi:hypothetical protein
MSLSPQAIEPRWLNAAIFDGGAVPSPEPVSASALFVDGSTLTPTSPVKVAFATCDTTIFGGSQANTFGMWAGDKFTSRDELDSFISYDTVAQFLALGGITRATQDATTALFVDDGNPIVACVGHTTAPNTIEHRLAFFGETPIARPNLAGINAVIAAIVDPNAQNAINQILDALGNLGLVEFS